MNIIRNSSPLTINQIADLAPSAMAGSKHSRTSSRYAYIPTIEIIMGMIKAGFMPFSATQSKATEDRRGFAKHMIRFRHESLNTKELVVGGIFPEIVLVNSHDGSSAYKLMAGIFRLVCSNGMIVADSTQSSITVRHQGDIIEQVLIASNTIVEQAPKLLNAVNEWSGIPLNLREQEALAKSAHILRFGDAEGNVNTPILPQQLLQLHRSEDQDRNLWSTFNVIQENVIKGGLSARQPAPEGKRGQGRRVTTRGVKGIDQDVRLNKALWTLAENMAKLKKA